MKSPVKSAVSIFDKRIEPGPLSSTSNPGDAIFSGYGCYSTDKKQESLPTSYDRRQGGIFYADIAIYSRLIEQDEEGRHHLLLESMNIVKWHIVANQGRVVHSAGDAILAEFKNASSALNCATGVQIAARLWNVVRHPDQYLRFRMGVDYGDLISNHSDTSSNAVNLAVRLDGLANSGGICVSESVRISLAGQSRFRFVAMGKRYLKNLSQPVQVFWIEVDSACTARAGLTGNEKLPAVAS